jgi:hypothetical protein
MANWTPEGFVGKSLQLSSRFAPPSPLPPPVLWGDESVVRQRLGQGTSRVTCTRQNVRFVYPFTPKETVEFFRRYFGPTQMAFSRLEPKAQAEFARLLEAQWTEHNVASDGTTVVDAEYLDVRAIRA